MRTPVFILAINPGNTSTKIGIFEDTKLLFQKNIVHSDEDLNKFSSIISQKDFRLSCILEEIEKTKFDMRTLSCVVGRGGLLRALESGTYLINEKMLSDLRKAERGEHASNLGAIIAYEIASKYNIPSYIVDPVAVDEMDDIARISGFVEIERESLLHALNTKAVAKRYAKKVGRKYEELRLIVAHLGSGISISAHINGRMVDVLNPRDEGPFSPDRAGGLPALQLVKLCFSGKYDFKTLEKKLFGEGGIYSYLGTRDLKKVIEMIDSGDSKAKLVFDAMVYQISNYIGYMAPVLMGKIDCIILTGGMAHERRLTDAICERISFLGNIEIFAGEDELHALAEGAYRVVMDEERVKIY
ncbi:MAG: butyrate kinase [Deltaproteobacteria bacterium]|nr:butyrate kinase [Deltaproteobacteria bacterium]